MLHRSTLSARTALSLSVLCLVILEPAFSAPIAKEANESTAQGADEECGQDRRCRLLRLKRLNSRRRQAEVMARERELLSQQEVLDQSKLRETPREVKPFSVGLTTFLNSDVGNSGFEVSWQWMKHLRLVGVYYGISEINQYDDPSFWTETGRAFKLGVRYLKGVKNFTTYFELYALQLLLEGELSNWGNDFGGVLGLFGGGGSSGGVFGDGELESHLIGVGTGVDWQLDSGFHLRLGLTTHYVLYATHRDRDSKANLPTKESAATLVSSAYSLVYDFSIGYAF